jgi:Domain of unknown function (DUF397)
MTDSSAVPEHWRTAIASGGTGCVQVRSDNGMVLVGDSKNPGPVLSYTPREWAAFIDGVKKSEFDEFALE